MSGKPRQQGLKAAAHITAHHWDQAEGGERTPVLSLPAVFYATQDTIVRDVVPPT